MLYLNLVSPNTKKEIEWRRLYETIKTASFILAAFCVIIAGLFWGAQQILRDSFQDNIKQNMSITPDFKQQDLGVDLEKRLQSIARIDNEFISWSYFLADIAKHTNEEITFTSLKIDREESSIQMKGKAEHRDALLEFKQNMESSDRFSKIIFPVENILQEENVEFNIEAKLKLKDAQ